MKIYIVLLACLISVQARSQELFVYTEPASNVPAHSLTPRLTQVFMNPATQEGVRYQAIPELVWGAHARWMLHAEGFFNLRDDQFKAEGFSLYTKYRWYSADEVHRHFRMAAFLRGAWSRGPMNQEAIDFAGMSSGWEAGWIGTALIDKLAISVTTSWMHALSNQNKAGYQITKGRQDAISYSLSAGRLMLPIQYRDYNQPNLNLMLECLGQTQLSTGNTFFDLAPSIQCILWSRMRVEAGYRFPLLNELERQASRSLLVRLEYTIFNLRK